MTPQPPGPGLPEHAPSVWITTFGFSLKSSVLPEPIVAIRLHLAMESQLAQIFVRVLALDQSFAVGVEPVIGAGEQEAERGTAGKRRQCGNLVCRERPHALIGLEKGPRLGDVEARVGLKAPGVEADGDVVSEHVGAGEVEVVFNGTAITEKEHVVGKEVGVDHALRQVLRPSLVEIGKLLADLGREAANDGV